METTREQLAEALYQKGLALAEMENLKVRMTSFSYLFIYVKICS